MKNKVKESAMMKMALLKFGCSATMAAIVTQTAKSGRKPCLNSSRLNPPSASLAERKMTSASFANSTGCRLNLYILSHLLAPLTCIPQTKSAMSSANEKMSSHGASFWYLLKSTFIRKTSMHKPRAILIACCCMKTKAELNRSCPII